MTDFTISSCQQSAESHRCFCIEDLCLATAANVLQGFVDKSSGGHFCF